MILPINQVMSEVDLNNIPKPTFNTLPTVKIKNTIALDFKDIYIDDDDDNLVREHGVTPAHIEDLRMSFGQGVDLTQVPPCVIKRKANGIDKPYELVYGFGRSFALMELGQKRWYFTEIEADEDSIDDVRAVENEPLPKLTNKEQDLKAYLVKKVRKGTLKNDELAIRKKLNQVSLHRKQQSKDRIVQWVLEDCGTPQKYSFYNKSKAQTWLENHSKKDYVIGGLDIDKDQYGFLVKEGYQYRFVVNAIRNYADTYDEKTKTGKHSYCIAHMGAPTANSSIPDKRIKFREELDSILADFKKCGMKTDFIHIAGALPQEKGIDDWKKLIQI
tara:strand:- start:29 stop:1018 length:990 start_codon:yes stop_codon:yes gene_type:complete